MIKFFSQPPTKARPTISLSMETRCSASRYVYSDEIKKNKEMTLIEKSNLITLFRFAC
jgi:hypothetical protein